MILTQASRRRIVAALSEGEVAILYARVAQSYLDLSEIIEAVLNPSVERSDPSQKAAFYVRMREFGGVANTLKRLGKSADFNQFVSHTQKLLKYILQFKKIPKTETKRFEKAASLFLAMKRAPNDLGKWWARNLKFVGTILVSQRWPNKEIGGLEAYKLGPFEVHNTLNLPFEDLGVTNEAIKTATKFLETSKIPHAARLLYGPIFVVGKLLESKTLAWYYSRDDTVYMRPHLKIGRGEVHSLIHELGHRYWNKFLSPAQKVEWIRYHRNLKDAGDSEDLDFSQLEEFDSLKIGDEFPMGIKGMKRGPKPVVVEIKKTPYTTSWVVEGGKNKSLRATVQRMDVVKVLGRTGQKMNRRAQFPTPYSATSPEEHFSEAFAMYNMGQLPKEHVEKFNALFS